MNEWDFLADVAEQLRANGTQDLPQGISTVVSDAVVAALTGEARANLERAQDSLEAFYLERLANAPPAASAAARGEGDDVSGEAAAFTLGQIGLAHAIVARAASRRIDDSFERLLLSRQLERYVRLLLEAEQSGKDLADALGKDEAEVSRRLKMLRQIGAVECRREGNRVINFLTPAARALARARNMGAIGAPISHGVLRQDIVVALDGHRSEFAPELKQPMFFAGGGKRRYPK